MAERPQDFLLYRLIINNENNTLNIMGRKAEGDEDYLAILRRAVEAELDVIVESKSNQYKYSVREYEEQDNEGLSTSPIVSLTLARSVVQQEGPIVTEDAIITGTSIPDRPIATTTLMLFFMERHIVAVANNSQFMGSQTWRSCFHDILDGAAFSLDIRSNLRIEPIPQQSEVLEAFFSFTLLRHLRVHLRLPNPELNRFSQTLYNGMINGGIRDYLQDMKNRDGLSQAQGQLPHASAAMADAGYKQGEVTMEGIRDGKDETVVTGQVAARVSMKMEGIRSYARGMEKLATTKEGKTIVAGLLEELNRAIPRQQDALLDDRNQGRHE